MLVVGCTFQQPSVAGLSNYKELTLYGWALIDKVPLQDSSVTV